MTHYELQLQVKGTDSYFNIEHVLWQLLSIDSETNKSSHVASGSAMSQEGAVTLALTVIKGKTIANIKIIGYKPKE